MIQRLPLVAGDVAHLMDVIERMAGLGSSTVLVGGLVPPLLLEALDPDGFDEAPSPRETTDCDLAIGLVIGARTTIDDIHQSLLDGDWQPDPQRSQFAWRKGGLKLDALPVPAGIEARDAAAVAAVARFETRAPEQFFRGYEFAMQAPVVIDVETPDGPRPLRIAGLVAILAAKLQARLDRRFDRKRDAHDIGWLVRYMKTTLIVDALRRAASMRSDLVAFVQGQLERSFSDADADGCMDYAAEAHGIVDEYNEPHREAVAMSIRVVLDAYRRLA